MAITLSPSDGLRNVSVYPTNPTTEAAARDQIQSVIDQIVNQTNSELADIPTKKNIINPTLINNWINSDTANYYGAEVWKDTMGYVHIRGMIQVSTGGTDSAVPFYLPAGYRPLKNYDFSVKTNLSIACSVRVRSDGAVIVYTPSAVASYINFGEIIFRAVD